MDSHFSEGIQEGGRIREGISRVSVMLGGFCKLVVFTWVLFNYSIQLTSTNLFCTLFNSLNSEIFHYVCMCMLRCNGGGSDSYIFSDCVESNV